MKSAHVAFNISHSIKNTGTNCTLNIGCLNRTGPSEKKKTNRDCLSKIDVKRQNVFLFYFRERQ